MENKIDTNTPSSPAIEERQLPRNVKLLGWASFLNDLASEAIYPLLPQFLLTYLGGNRLHLGVIEGIGESVASLMKLWSGARSDRVRRRKPFVVFGYCLAAISHPLVGFVAAPWQLFVVRLADRTGKGIRTSPRDALVADSSNETKRGRAFGFQNAMDNLGAALGPIVASGFLWFYPGQLRWLFLLTLFPGIILIGLVFWGLREPSKRTRSEMSTTRLTWKPLSTNFRRYLLALGLFSLGNSSDAFLLVRAGELGVPVVALPLLWLVFNLVKSGGNLVVGSWVDRVGAKLPLSAGWGVYASTYILLALATASWHAWLCFVIYGLAYAMIEPSEKTLVGQLVGADQRGQAYGWYNFAIGIAALPASVLFGVLYQQLGHQVAFLWGASLALVAVVFLRPVEVPRA